MPIRRSPNGAAHTSPQTDRDQSEQLIGMGRYAQIGIIVICLTVLAAVTRKDGGELDRWAENRRCSGWVRVI
jgi:hypothetical protein